MNTLPLMLSSTVETPYYIDPLFLFRVRDTEGDPLYIASGTTFTPPTGPYLLAED